MKSKRVKYSFNIIHKNRLHGLRIHKDRFHKLIRILTYNRTFFSIVLILTLFFSPGCTIRLPGNLPSKTTPTDPQAELTQRLDQYLTTETEKKAFSGSVLIAQNGKILLKKGYGYANVEWDQPNTADTVFRIASLTKGFTALATLKLEEQGRLSLKDPLSKYIPNFPRGNQITLEQLLTHTSGIRDYTAAPDFPLIMGSPVSLDTLLNRIKAQPYDSSPGSTFRYNNSGYILLGMVLEKVTGKPYAAVLQELILNPLGLTHTGYDENQVPVKNLASGYVYTGGILYNAPALDLSNVYAAGGMRSTLNDLYTYSQAFNDPNLLKKENWQRLFTPVREHYGLGWVIEPLGQEQAIYHTGSIPGYSSILARFPDENLTIIILSNLTGVPVKEMTENLAAITLGKPTTTLSNLKPVQVDPKILETYTGEYRLAVITATIFLKEGKLYGQLTGQPAFELVPISNTQFVVQNLGIEINFVLSGGKTDRLILKQNGRELTARKIS